ncbi:hypothetical protein JOL79_22285 [Microbispora sp. RL4-1S]|uniref:Uncharacterized protein n=1 Tax=Microbispora oryzae TaxID=2806554 RepID=A0A941AKW3_9ACTN|nr:hypothetical protein [Microbispora oryzae]MBP2706542.1 hypothetical protein [Microbispora oryzae]
MADGKITRIGRCYACRETFGYDPDTVTTVLIDPQTRLPPGMTPFGTRRQPSPAALARAEREPICPRCVERARRFREEQTADPSAGWPTWRRDQGDSGSQAP